MDSIIICPNCNSDLEDCNEYLKCINCGSAWPVKNSIPQFMTKSYYWGEIPLERMIQVNTSAYSKGWRYALNEYVEKDYPHISRYVLSENRADFSYLTKLDENGVVLDIGSGWGAITCQLAKRFAKVVSLESVKERIEFLQIRAQQEGLSNIIPIQASFLELPLQKNSFDLIVLNGVLEWIGIADENIRPDQLQKKVLKKLLALLKPGGVLYIGIENRFWYGYFLGRPDHTGLPFTSLLPRGLADIVMKFRKHDAYRTNQAKNSYRTYTYSYWGYKDLLKKVGFYNVDIYMVFPDYNHPNYIIPSHSYKAFLYLITNIYSGNTIRKKSLRLISRMIAPLYIQLLFAPCFSIYAEKD